jgi:drug/metabolite transporter (DMT)-like permease
MSGTLAAGLACALAAGLLWGTVFIAPLLLPDYPPAVLSAGRYLAFGLVALPLALADRSALARLTRADWLQAARLALVGNLAYYAMLAAAIQTAGAPLPTMIIGTLPVVIAVSANLGQPALAWRRLLVSLAVLAAGIALVNLDEVARLGERGESASQLVAGVLLAAGAVVCWTWYPIRNAAWLRTHPATGDGTWATAQGLATLPLAALACLLIAAWPAVASGGAGQFEGPFGPQPLRFAAMMLAIAVGASWLGTLLWNRASRLLPTALAGQLIVFETLAALGYAFALRGEAPGPATLAGIVLLVAGVMLGVRAARDPHP